MARMNVPRFRGWLHAGMFPLAIIAALSLVTIGETLRERVASAIFGGTGCLLFGISALYHRVEWSDRIRALLRRFDHANIFLIIAGSYTPFALLLLPERTGRGLLWVIWVGAIVGVIFRMVWLNAPRWIYTPIYLGLGWAAVFFLPAFYRSSGLLVFGLIALGGLFYSIGAIIYATKWPNPSDRWFGFHELFHAFTIAAFLSHYAAAVLTVLRVQ
jgi:hemolysin III